MPEYGWIQTASGRKVFPLSLRPADVYLADIAHSLSNQCRFTGHTKWHYSVAQHSILVSLHCDPAVAMWGLLHDASEAYLSDIPRPLKALPGFGDVYLAAERVAMDAVCDHFGLSHGMPASVEHADREALATEKRDVMGPEPEAWMPMPDPWRERIKRWSPARAEREFLGRYFDIVAGMVYNGH